MLRKIWARILIVCLLLTLSVPAVAAADTSSAQKETVSILFSHDMHSHLEKFARIKTVIDEEKKANGATFVVDAGDFSMGTPYQTIYKSEASELRMMGAVGYDVTTIGNHEFDYRSKGITQMLYAAINSGDKLPQLVISNIDWEGTLADEKLKDDGQNLKGALEAYGAKDYTVLERSGARIAVFGVFGQEAASYAPESGTYFKPPVETAQAVVDEINKKEDVDLIVCISHSGTNPDNPEDSEDEILAEQVEGIDLIVSGHSHTLLEEPVVINDTVVASCGQYNSNLGKVTFTKENGAYVLDEYTMLALDESVKDDEKTAELTETFKDMVDDQYFEKFGYSWDQTLAENRVDFTDIDTFGTEQGEDTLGSLIADAYRYGVRMAEGEEYQDVDVTVAPAGVIRGSFGQGKITVEDAFNALSLGTGKDGVAGYPLVSVYLTGEELKLAAEIDISVSEIMQPARLYFSGLNYTYNPNRLILNRAYDVVLENEDGETEALEDDRLYRVVADLYSAQMLGTVNSMSYGLLSVVPKDQSGKEIINFEDHIIYNNDGSELKEWHALAAYIDSFDGNQMPDRYEQPEGRKVLEDSTAIGDILKKPNKFFWMICAAAVLVIAVLALIVVLVVKLVRKMRYGKGTVKKKDMIFGR
ncbi:MAG: bifunctional UDP-sugar hydrolase/5'-nucleotidase [Emergencia sp.]|nr:bifunctional UDP-sugar hydrolase/5'-nucleotidase [Emergencia sp.]